VDETEMLQGGPDALDSATDKYDSAAGEKARQAASR
jgi:hypothetical protein